jgi:phosphoribosylformylglycinamidine (FGAM) synthase-like enzyme
VQIGHPITERRFTSAIPALRDAGLIRSITDLGAGGISCAAGEMGSETGVRLDLDNVPLKDRSLTAWEILLSESQERMLIAVPPQKLAEAEAILDRYEVAHSILGHFTDTKRLEAYWQGQKVVDLEMSFLWEACPIDSIPVAEPRPQLTPLSIPEPQTAAEWSETVQRVLTHYHCAEQLAAGSRFDTTVQGRTAVGPYGGKNHRMPTNIYVSAPLRGKTYGVITTVAYNPFYGEISPAAMARLMMIEAVTKAVVAGADYREMALCDNFYTPRVRPEMAWHLKQMVETISDLSIELGIPFISGKDSSSGTLESAGRKIDVPQTLVVSVLGRVPDVRKIISKDFKRARNEIVLVGRFDSNALGGSVYADCYGQRGDRLFDAYDAAAIQALWDALLRLHSEGGYVSGSAIAEGGMLLRLFEAAFGSGLGARIELDSSVAGRKDGFLFGEFTGSVLLEMPGGANLAEALAGVPHKVVGRVIAEPELVLAADGTVIQREPISTLAEGWAKTLREVVE